ncbi:hypothetical protein MsedC_1358 [Metallosphaera sedula]|uniref:Uncharacterized protein n=2 Tax=Metallosphaera sedula TaxID=43687 RepID=A4YGE6_METS5|nr:hypothetical protein [Metallosphaera sedula]ABP95498.1 hypothetical protein Msed_1340 [Metallosphaera sedula DSM 5348]AKV78843.1 hypothetical protein MsedC_1358 [Metallosphaera sedula]AKV81088.1 hypothetical protein MsedD_1359 [Metallosphaera sedula]AKV83326.1 hypothetical protein MsedE_1364 [Metallosphaera sedula]WPX05348.1 hypothetical protein SOJ17_001316 [Metallosphaera sedula DSM 5348]
MIRYELTYLGRAFVASSIILLLLSAIFFMSDQDLSNTMGDFTYFFLVIGVLLVGAGKLPDDDESEDQEHEDSDKIPQKS